MHMTEPTWKTAVYAALISSTIVWGLGSLFVWAVGR
jgi:hypothetical protein